ncbi:hypothetical protein ACDA63_07405 [Uliginosibacterium sp. sgz301328]|uniref:hypothetical protein n=1 Tax=Uliginosibacterium sp. sgz301328 TaxID=3243764 RepID=UPI00359D2474
MMSPDYMQIALEAGFAQTDMNDGREHCFERFARLVAERVRGVPDEQWRELCRRLYVELFACDQQMTNTLDEDGEPMWQTGITVRDVLAEAKAMLAAAPAAPSLVQGCCRSHPHEGMNAECERKTVEARAASEAAQVAPSSPAPAHATVWCEECGDGIVAHNPGICGTCYAVKYRDRAAPAPVVPEEWLLVPTALLDRFPELNLCNYTSDDVDELNAWGIEVMLAAAPAAPAPVMDKSMLKRLVAQVFGEGYHIAPAAPDERGEVVVTWDQGRTRIIAVTRQDDEGKILSVIAEAPAAPAPDGVDARLELWLTAGAGELHPNTKNLVVRFARALASKLLSAEKKYGYTDGWRSPDWMDECRAKLIEHMGKGDPRDVAAYCAFLWFHGESTAAPAPVVDEPVAIVAESGRLLWHAGRSVEQYRINKAYRGPLYGRPSADVLADAKRYRRLRENWIDCEELNLHGRLAVVDKAIDAARAKGGDEA